MMATSPCSMPSFHLSHPTAALSRGRHATDERPPTQERLRSENGLHSSLHLGNLHQCAHQPAFSFRMYKLSSIRVRFFSQEPLARVRDGLLGKQVVDLGSRPIVQDLA